jgi:hypothetical protein
MRTSGIAAPDSPVTVPVIDPPATWEFAGTLQSRSKTKKEIAYFKATPYWLTPTRKNGPQEVDPNQFQNERLPLPPILFPRPEGKLKTCGYSIPSVPERA